MFYCGKPPASSRELSDRSSLTILPKASTSSLDSPSYSALVAALKERGAYMFSTLCTSPRRNTETKKTEKIIGKSLKKQKKVRKNPYLETEDVLSL